MAACPHGLFAWSCVHVACLPGPWGLCGALEKGEVGEDRSDSETCAEALIHLQDEEDGSTYSVDAIAVSLPVPWSPHVILDPRPVMHVILDPRRVMQHSQFRLDEGVPWIDGYPGFRTRLSVT